MQPTILLYQIKGDKLTKIRLLCQKLRLRARLVGSEQFDSPIAAALSGDTAPAGKPLEGEMLVLAGLSQGQFQAFLNGFRQNRIPPVPLKAVLTPTNALWTPRQLYAQLVEEHALHAALQTNGFDTIVCGGTLVDGTGAAPKQADVAILGDKIVAIGDLSSAPAKRRIDASGKCVTPGFVDIHRHADAAVFRKNFGELELAQGLTTIVNGNCGLAIAPIVGPYAQQIRQYLQPVTGDFDDSIPTQTMDAYLSAVAKQPLPLHVGMLAGNGTIRTAVCGYDVLHPQPEQFDAIHAALEQSLAAGALGVSLGLGYAPECFYTTDELILALSPLAHSHIPITVHMRQEGDGVADSVREMRKLAEALDTPVHISHLKAMGTRNWNRKIPEALSLIEQARQDGLNLSCDVYPYPAGSTQLLHILPPDFLEGGVEAVCKRLADPDQRQRLTERIQNGHDFDNIAQLVGWDNIVLATLNRPENKHLEGLSIARAAEKRGQDPYNCCYDLLLSERCAITMIDYIACEGDIAAILQAPFSNLISDSTYPLSGRPHPRLYGTFVRAIEKYVVQERVLTLEQAVAKMTSIPAQVLGLHRKGRLAVGADADLNLFVPEKLHEVGTFSQPDRLASGIDATLVGGQIAMEAGRLTGNCGGTVLRR